MHHDLHNLTGLGPPILLAFFRAGHVFVQLFTLLTSWRIFQDDEPEESVASHDTGKQCRWVAKDGWVGQREGASFSPKVYDDIKFALGTRDRRDGVGWRTRA